MTARAWPRWSPRDESILLVLDNFATNLKPRAEPDAAGADPVWACQDPAWDQCLAALAVGLGGAPSRVLITSRRPLTALARGAVRTADPTGSVRTADPTGAVRAADPTGLTVLLGQLPAAEAAIYLREQPTLGGSRVWRPIRHCARGCWLRLRHWKRPRGSRGCRGSSQCSRGTRRSSPIWTTRWGARSGSCSMT